MREHHHNINILAFIRDSSPLGDSWFWRPREMSGHERSAAAGWRCDGDSIVQRPTTTRAKGEGGARRRRRRTRATQIEIPSQEVDNDRAAQWEHSDRQQSESSNREKASGKIVYERRTWNHDQQHQYHKIISIKILLADKARIESRNWAAKALVSMADDKGRPIKKTRLKLNCASKAWLAPSKDACKHSALVPILALVLIGAVCWPLGSEATLNDKHHDSRQSVRKQAADDASKQHLRAASTAIQQLQPSSSSIGSDQRPVTTKDTSGASSAKAKLSRAEKQRKEGSPDHFDQQQLAADNSVGNRNSSAPQSQRRRSTGKPKSGNSKQTRDAHQQQQQTAEASAQELASFDYGQQGFDYTEPQLGALVSDGAKIHNNLQQQDDRAPTTQTKASRHEQQQQNLAVPFPDIIPNGIEPANLNQPTHHQNQLLNLSSDQQQQLEFSMANNRAAAGGGGSRTRSSGGHELASLMPANERQALGTMDGGETTSDYMTAIPLERQHSASIKVVFNNNPQFIIGRGERNQLDIEQQLLRKLSSRSGHSLEGSASTGDFYHPDESNLDETRVALGQAGQQPSAAAVSLNQSSSSQIADQPTSGGGLPCSKDQHHHQQQLNVEQIDLAGQEPPPPRPSKTKTRPPATKQPVDQQQQHEVDTPFEQIVKGGLRPPLRMVVSMRNKEGDMMKVPINLRGSSRQPAASMAAGHVGSANGRVGSQFEQDLQAPEPPRLRPKPMDENTPVGGDFFDPSLVKPFPRKSAPSVPTRTSFIEPPPPPPQRGQKQSQVQEEMVAPEEPLPQFSPPTRRPPTSKTAPSVKRPDCHEAPRPAPTSTSTTTTTPPPPPEQQQQQQEEEPQQQQQDEDQQHAAPMIIGSSEEIVQMMVPKLTEFHNKTFATMFAQFQKALNEQMQGHHQQQQQPLDQRQEPFDRQQQNDEQEDLMVAMLAANMTGSSLPSQDAIGLSMTVIKPPKGTSLEEAIRVHTKQQANTGASVAILQSKLAKRRPTVDNFDSRPLEAGPVPVDIHLRSGHAPPNPIAPSSGSIVPDSESELENGNQDDDGFSSGSELVGNVLRRQQLGGGRRHQQQHGSLAPARYKRSSPSDAGGVENGTATSISSKGRATVQKRFGSLPRHQAGQKHSREVTNKLDRSRLQARKQPVPASDSKRGDYKTEAIFAAASENRSSDDEPDPDDGEPEEDAEPADSGDSADSSAAASGASPMGSDGDDFSDGSNDVDSDESEGLFDSDDEPFNQGASSDRDYNSPSSFEIPQIDINPNTLKQKGCKTVLREVQEIPVNRLGAVQANGEPGSGYSSPSDSDFVVSRLAAHNRVKRQLLAASNNDNLINSRKVTSIVMTKECHFPNEPSSASHPAVPIGGGSHKRTPAHSADDNSARNFKSAKTRPAPAARQQYSAAAAHLAPAIANEPSQSDRKPSLAAKKHLTAISAPYNHELMRQQQQQLVNLYNNRLSNNLRQQQQRQLVEPAVKPASVGHASASVLAFPAAQTRQYLSSGMPIDAQVQMHKLLQAQQRPAQLIRRRSVSNGSGRPVAVPVQISAGQKPRNQLIMALPPPQARVGASKSTNNAVAAAIGLRHHRQWPVAQQVRLNDRDFYVGADSRRNEVVAQKLYKPPSADDPFHTLSYSSKNGNDPDMDDDEDDRIVAEPEELERPRLAARVAASNVGQFEQREAPTERERKALMDPNYDDTDPVPAPPPKRRGANRRGQSKENLVDSILDEELKGEDGDDRRSSSQSSAKLARPDSPGSSADDADESDSDFTDESRPAPSEKRRVPPAATSTRQAHSRQQPVASRHSAGSDGNDNSNSVKAPGDPKAWLAPAPIHRSIIHEADSPARSSSAGDDYDDESDEPRVFGKSFRFEHQVGRPESGGLMGQLRDLKPGGQGFVRVESERAKTAAGRAAPNGANSGAAPSGAKRSEIADPNDAGSGKAIADDDNDDDDVSRAADESASRSAIRRNQPHQQQQRRRQHVERREDDDLDDQDEDNEVPAAGNYGARAQASRESSAPAVRSRGGGAADNEGADAASEDDPDSDPDYNAKEGQLPANVKPKRVQKSFAYVHRDLPRDGSKNSDDFVVSYGRGNLQTEHEDYDSDRDNRSPEDRAASVPRRSVVTSGASSSEQRVGPRRAEEAPKLAEHLGAIGSHASSPSRDLHNPDDYQQQQQQPMQQRRQSGSQQQGSNKDTRNDASKSAWAYHPAGSNSNRPADQPTMRWRAHSLSLGQTLVT